MPLEQTTAPRFTVIRGTSPEEIVEKLNTETHPYARVIHVGFDEIDSVFAIVDLALPLVLTLDDVEGMSLDAENDSLGELSANNKLNMSA